MIHYWKHRDRLHWEVRLGRVVLSRWCEGAPCALRNWEGPHPVHLTIVRKGH
jgi:hypothetical protein